MGLMFISPNGQKFDVDDPSRPEVAAWIRENSLTPEGEGNHGVKDFFKSALSGAYEGIVRAPMIAGDLNKLALHGINKIRPETVKQETIDRWGSQGWIDAFRDSPQDRFLRETLGLDALYEPQTTTGRYAKAGTSGATGAMTLGGVRALGAVPALIAGGSSLAGEFGYDVSRGFDETKPGNPLVALGTTLAAGGTANAVRQGRAANYPQQIYNAGRSMPEAEWEKAVTSLENFRKSGSKSYTLADLPELQPRVGGLAAGMSNTAGGDVLRYKLSPQVRRDVDIPNLLRQNIDDLGTQTFDPRELAEALAKRGGAKIDKTNQAIYTARNGNLRGHTLDPIDLLAATNRYVRKPRILPHNQSEGQRAAFDSAESALLGKEATKTPMIRDVVPPVLDLQALSQNVKAIEKIPLNPASNPSGAVRNYQAANAREAAEKALDKASKGQFGKAMSQFQLSKQTLVEPLERGLPGQIRNATDEKALVARLREVPADKLRGELNTLGVTPDEAKKLARLVGQNIKPIPDLTDAIGSNSLKDRKLFEALQDYADPSLVGPAKNRLGVADSLARLHSEYGTDRAVNLHMGKNPGSTLINPFGEGSFRLRLSRSAKETQKLSDLLANPSAENLQKLRELSKTNPDAKRALEWISSLSGAAQSTAVHK